MSVVQQDVQVSCTLSCLRLREPGLLLHNRRPLIFRRRSTIEHLLGDIDGGRSYPRRLPFVHLRVDEGKLGQICSEEDLPLSESSHFNETVEEKQNGRHVDIKLEPCQDHILLSHNILLRVGKIGDLAEVLELWRVDLFILRSNEQTGDAE